MEAPRTPSCVRMVLSDHRISGCPLWRCCSPTEASASGAASFSLSVLVAFFQYGLRFFRPIQDLSEKYNILQSAMAASERVFKLLDTPARITSPAVPRKFSSNPWPIEFDQVWFAYPDFEDWVLRDVSFRIDPETIAVVGHTGAGKGETLTSLLLRFYDIQRGSIKIGGVDIREVRARRPAAALHGVVLQDRYLFTGTVDSNIRLGTEWIEASAVEQAAGQVNLLEFVRELPEGFAHPVPRSAARRLSTGQKQLISFARALAHNPRVLILDEATSSVDTETEIPCPREALARMVEGRTSLVIAHRLSTIQRADRILVMHKGQLRESGSHQELLVLRGIYWKLYQLQYKDQEISNDGLEDYPIGKFTFPQSTTPAQREQWISEIAETPAKMRLQGPRPSNSTPRIARTADGRCAKWFIMSPRAT